MEQNQNPIQNKQTTREELVARTQTAASLSTALPTEEHYKLPKIEWSGVENYKPTPIDTPDWQDYDPLPKADVVIMTWTTAEWAALNHVFCGYDQEMTLSGASRSDWRKGWLTYSRNYYQIHQYMVDVEKTYQGGAPSLHDMAWGEFRMVDVNGLKVMLVKSGMHLAQDGTDLPLSQFILQICDEAKPSLLLSIGTAGGVRTEDALGCALVTNQAFFYLLKEFKNADYNGTTVQSNWTPETAHLDYATSQLLQVAGYPIEPVSPQYPTGAAIEPDTPDSQIKIVTDEPIITTDCFLFGTTTNGLYKHGCIVEMDDAVVGMACQGKNVPFGFIRNVSDPVINGKLPSSLQDAWAAYIYKERGLFTSYNGALAAWAMVAGESDKTKGK